MAITHLVRCGGCKALVRWVYTSSKRWYSCDECGEYGEEEHWD